MEMGVEQDRLNVAGLLPLMTIPQPDTSERKKREMQAIPFAFPPPRKEPDERPDSDLPARRRD